MHNTKSNTTLKKQKSASVNIFVQMIEDKKKIEQAIEEGQPLSTLKDIKFVKPL